MKFFTTSKISENMHETPEGYLVCVGVSIARCGEQVYARGETPLEVGPDGMVYVDRPSEEVFRPETIASFEGKGITIFHPDSFLTPENHSTLGRGTLHLVRRGEGAQEMDLVADLLVTDREAIDLIKAGLREVSCGYEAEYTQTGVGRGVQRNIVGNHLALVEEGRAGSSYAINDHKGAAPMKLKDRIKAIFAKAQDDAMKIADEVEPDEKKDKKAKDAEPDPKAPKKDEKKTGDEEVASGLEARLKALEDKVAALMADQSEDADGEEEEVVAEDADSEEEGESEDADSEEESEDDDFEESTMTGDSAADPGDEDDDELASRIEILAPGMKVEGKNVRARALKTAYATKDGKTQIHKLTGGKAPDFKDSLLMKNLFVAASELLKMSRTSDFAKTKSRDGYDEGASDDVMTPEKLNEANAKRYAVK